MQIAIRCSVELAEISWICLYNTINIFFPVRMVRRIDKDNKFSYTKNYIYLLVELNKKVYNACNLQFTIISIIFNICCWCLHCPIGFILLIFSLLEFLTGFYFIYLFNKNSISHHQHYALCVQCDSYINIKMSIAAKSFMRTNSNKEKRNVFIIFVVE